MKTFKEVRQYLNSIPDINCGGCAIAALAMQRWLKKNRNKESIIVYYHSFYSSESYHVNQKYNLGIVKYPSSCTHATVRVSSKNYDSEGLHKTSRYFRKIILDEKGIIKSINRYSIWNDDFDRKYIKEIECKLDIDLSDIKVKRRTIKQ